MQTIDITTTQNVTIQYELASLRDRIIAFVIDALLLTLSLLIIVLIYRGAFEGRYELFFTYFVLIPIAFFYTLAMEYFNDGQTIGKKAIGIKVIKLDGKAPTLGDYLARWGFRMVDIFLSIGSIASLLISSSEKGQRLGDMAANTTLIKVKFNIRFRLEDIERITTLEDYEPLYPQVRQLSEDDMLFIKNVITRVLRYPNQAHLDVVNELTEDLILKLGIDEKSKHKINFLKTLIKDYIVLTR
jgi:uncharacterized RDD family membrane protein YckC